MKRIKTELQQCESRICLSVCLLAFLLKDGTLIPFILHLDFVGSYCYLALGLCRFILFYSSMFGGVRKT